MAQTTQYTIDGSGNMNSTGSPGMVDVTGGASSLGSLAPHPQSSDPYAIFNGNLMSMLATAQKNQQENAQNLGGAKDTLTNLSVAPNGPQPFNPNVFSGSQVQGQETLQKSFDPAITSINTELENSKANYSELADFISKEQGYAQPLQLSPGQSLVTRDGTVLKSGHSYTPQVNPVTGLIDGFDQNTGTWASSDGASSTPTPPSDNSSLVGGVDFSGAATSTKPYATDPNYASEVDSMYNQILKTQPVPSAAGLDQFITSHVGGKSNVTGQMVITAAGQYGIDPNLLAAVLGHESDFGTAGAGAKTMNPGNVGNTGTSTQNYPSWQQGVNAAAYEIARRMPGNKNAQSAPSSSGAQNAVSPVGGQFSSEATQKVGQLPPSVRPYVDAGPLGVAYINSDRVPDNFRTTTQTLAARAGIPYVAPADVGAIKSIETVLGNLDNMQTLAEKNLNSGVIGHITDTLAGGASQFLQNDWGIQLGLFDNYRDTAIKAVQALAGGTGSGLRINMGEIQANVQNLPRAGDSKENAIAQIKQLRQLIYTNMAASFPYATAKVMSPQGQTGNLPIGNLSTAINKGYSVI